MQNRGGTDDWGWGLAEGRAGRGEVGCLELRCEQLWWRRWPGVKWGLVGLG